MSRFLRNSLTLYLWFSPVVALAVGFDFSNVPDDLKETAARVEHRVLIPEAQGEYTFGASVAKVQVVKDSTGYGKTIALRELGALDLEQAHTGVEIGEFRVRELWYDEGEKRSDAIVQIVNSLSSGPGYYCHALRAIGEDYAPSVGKRCRALLKELVEAADNGKRSVFVVTIKGELYGNYARAIVYLSSVDEPGTFLRLDLDLIHEI